MSRSPQVNPISPRTRELLEMATIESQFPVQFEDGGGFPMFTAYCAWCKRPIANRHLRGLVTRSRKDMYTVEAAGACFTCKIATPVSLRLHQDGSMTGMSPHSGAWTRWDTRPSLLRRILHSISPKRF